LPIKSFSGHNPINSLTKEKTDLLKSPKALGTAGVRRIPAILLQILDGSRGSRIVEPRNVESSGAAERADLVEPNTAEAKNSVAARVRLRNPNATAKQRALQRVHAPLRVVRHHREVGFRRRLWSRRRHLESRPGVCREEPRR
jgi:hypothetical protein